jgi:tetratricopeptide (TPR) repeat protein
VATRAPDDFEVLLEHWKGCGETSRAGLAAQGAADRAAAALAFERAAALYDEARGLLGERADAAHVLEKAGTAYANAGQAVLAAERLLAAAEKLGEQADRTHIRALRRQAAEQYIKCGHLVDGWAVMRGLLEEMQISVPGSTRSALLAAMVQRVRFLMNPLKVEDLRPRPVSPEDSARLEMLWVASTSLAMVNTALADEIRTRHLLSVFKHGDASAILQALAYEAAMETLLPGNFFAKRADTLLAKASFLAEKTQGPYDLAWTLLGKSISAFSRGQYRKAAELCEESDRVFRERCPGSAWIRATVAYFHYQALVNSGQLKVLREKMTAQAAEAERRNDTFGLSECFTGDEALAWIAVGKGGWARQRAEVELARQAPKVDRWPENCFRTQQYADVVAQVHTYLYDGEPWSALKAILGRWSDLNGNFFLTLRQVGTVCWFARGRAALAAAEHLAHGGQRPADMDAKWNVPTLLADVRRSAKALEKDVPCGGLGLAASLRGGVLHVQGNRQEAIAELRKAMEQLEKTEMVLHYNASRLVLGSVVDGQGALLRSDATEWMVHENVSHPERLSALLIPGFRPAPNRLSAPFLR